MKYDGLLEGMFRKTWIVVTIGLLLVMINTIVDGIFIGQFFGKEVSRHSDLSHQLFFFWLSVAISGTVAAFSIIQSLSMVIGMAKDVQYLPMMRINQLIIKI